MACSFDVVIERDGRVLVRAPHSIPDAKIAEIIDAIAIDFRLGVQSTRTKKNGPLDDVDLKKAAKTLLELYAHLQAEQTREEELTTRVPLRVTEPVTKQ